MDESSKAPQSMFRRKKFACAIAVLILIAGGLGIICQVSCWHSTRTLIAGKEREAAAAISKLGGSVSFSDEPSKDNPEGKPPGPILLRKIFGDKFYVTAQHATVINDEGMKYLDDLPHLRELVLRGDGVTNVGMRHVKGCCLLTLLQLWDTAVDDEGMQYVDGSIPLEHLYISSSRITDAGLAPVRSLSNLWELYLNGDRFTGVGLGELRGLKNLYSISLHGPGIDDTSLEYLEPLTQVRSLNLEGTRVTEQGRAKLHQILLKCRIDP